jgi:hypothetical protein
MFGISNAVETSSSSSSSSLALLLCRESKTPLPARKSFFFAKVFFITFSEQQLLLHLRVYSRLSIRRCYDVRTRRRRAALAEEEGGITNLVTISKNFCAGTYCVFLFGGRILVFTVMSPMRLHLVHWCVRRSSLGVAIIIDVTSRILMDFNRLIAFSG